jgi:hypothetical protein
MRIHSATSSFEHVSSMGRTCFRCDEVFHTGGIGARVYCPECRSAYGFPAPTVPALPVQLDLLSQPGEAA